MITITNVPGTVEFLNRGFMPSDDYMVCSAVVDDSYDSKISPITKHNRLQEELIMQGHFGVLDHVAPTFKISCPIFVARQILRASNASFNEKSGRYKKMEPVFYVPPTFYLDVPRKELGKEHPGIDNPDTISIVNSLYELTCNDAWNYYEELLKIGIRKEQARMVLPLNTFTEFWMTLKLSDWLHFLNLRLDTHAQEETQFIALGIYQGLKSQFPKILEYWEKYAKGPINKFGTIQTA